MFTFPVLTICVVTVAFGTCWSIYALKNNALVVRVSFAVSSIGLAGILLRLIALTASAPLRQWNGARLAPLMAFAKGLPLYGDARTGALSAWIYGPVPALAYLPASLFHRPTGCIICGVVLSELMIFTPALFAMSRSARSPENHSRLIGPLIMSLFLCIVLQSESLSDGIFFILSDVPAVAFITVACLLLMRERSIGAVITTALLVVLACWSKQTVLSFTIVPLFFLFLIQDRRAVKVYLGSLLAFGAVISASLIYWFGGRAMWFNMVTIPSHQPLKYTERGNLVSIVHSLREWLQQAIQPAIPLTVAIVIGLLIGRHAGTRLSKRNSLAELLHRRPWTILLFAPLALLPASLLGYAKVAGFYNNFAISLFFLLLGGSIAVIDLWPSLEKNRPTSANWIAVSICIFIFVSGITDDALRPGALGSMAAQIDSPSNNPQETMFDIEQAHPGMFYFPWDPLPALLVERKLYHFEWGFADRLAANILPSQEQISAHVPSHMQFIAFPPATRTRFTLKSFPTFTLEGRSPMLPGFTVFKQPDGAVPSRGSE